MSLRAGALLFSLGLEWFSLSGGEYKIIRRLMCAARAVLQERLNHHGRKGHFPAAGAGLRGAEVPFVAGFLYPAFKKMPHHHEYLGDSAGDTLSARRSQ